MVFHILERHEEHDIKLNKHASHNYLKTNIHKLIETSSKLSFSIPIL